MTLNVLTERLITACQNARAPHPSPDLGRTAQTAYSDELNTVAAQIRTMHFDARARLLHTLVNEIAAARDADLEAQARRRHLIPAEDEQEQKRA